jgi:hypothetical protein
MTTRRLPVPHVQSLAVCREIWHDVQMGEIVLVGPVSHWRGLPADRAAGAAVGVAS